MLGFNVIDCTCLATCSFLWPKIPENNVARPNPIVVIMPIGFQSSAVEAAVALAKVVSVVASVAVAASVDDSVAASPATDFVAVSTPSATEVDAGKNV